MRRILIALALAMASTGAAAQTTEGAEERTEQRTLTERVSELVQRTTGWAPTGQVRELQAELEQLSQTASHPRFFQMARMVALTGKPSSVEAVKTPRRRFPRRTPPPHPPSVGLDRRRCALPLQ